MNFLSLRDFEIQFIVSINVGFAYQSLNMLQKWKNSQKQQVLHETYRESSPTCDIITVVTTYIRSSFVVMKFKQRRILKTNVMNLKI